MSPRQRKRPRAVDEDPSTRAQTPKRFRYNYGDRRHPFLIPQQSMPGMQVPIPASLQVLAPIPRRPIPYHVDEPMPLTLSPNNDPVRFGPPSSNDAPEFPALPEDVTRSDSRTGSVDQISTERLFEQLSDGRFSGQSTSSGNAPRADAMRRSRSESVNDPHDDDELLLAASHEASQTVESDLSHQRRRSMDMRSWTSRQSFVVRSAPSDAMDVSFPVLDEDAPGSAVSPLHTSNSPSDASMAFSTHPNSSPNQEEHGDRYTMRQRAYPPMVIGFTNAHNRRRKDQETRNLQASVRQMMKEELGFTADQALPHPPASITDIANFLNGGPGATLDFLQLDLVTTSDGIRSHWNIDAGTKFARLFLDRVHETLFDEDAFKNEDLTISNIRTLFLTRIRYFMRLYRNAYFPVPSNVRKLRKQLDRRTSRRISLFRLRRRVVREDSQLGKVFDSVDDELISEDETDTELSIRKGLKVVRRVEKGWVNPELTHIFHDALDVHHQRLDIFGEFGAGNRFRQRVNHPPKRVVWTGVVVGLPENFYNPVWLERLTKEEKAALVPSPAVDLRPFVGRLGRRCCDGRPQREGSPIILFS